MSLDTERDEGTASRPVMRGGADTNPNANANTHASSSALQKGTAVLRVLSRAGLPLGLSEISRALGLPRQTVHRVLGQLEALALVARVPGGEGFVVGPSLIDLGLNALTAAMDQTPIRQLLRGLVDQVGETCNVGVMDRDDVVYIERVECDWPLRVQYGPGSRVPPHASAIGKLLLAHLPARTRRRILQSAPLAQLTDRTLTDPDALEAQFRAIRKQGYAINDQENVVGLMGFAVPVRAKGGGTGSEAQEAEGKVIAGLSLHAPVARMTAENAVQHLAKFQTASVELAACFEDLRASNLDHKTV